MFDWAWITTTVPTSLMVVVKAVGVYIALIAFTRLAGLRSFSKMSSYDFAITVAFGSVLASTILSGEPPLLQSIVALAALFAIQYAISMLRTRSGTVAAAVDNGPMLIMAGSDILHDNLRAVRMTEDDLYAKLREANVTRWDQVRAVVMESTGDVSVLHADPDAPPLETDLLHGVRRADRLHASSA
jgi:uncharacterized membrane protein YcaP (DUF421 family)